MTTIKIGDALNLTGSTRVADVSMLKAMASRNWTPYGSDNVQKDINLTSKWQLGYQYAIASGPNMALTYWQHLNNELAAMPNSLCTDALGTMPWSINAAGNVEGRIRKATAAELASMSNSNNGWLNNIPCVGCAAITYPYGISAPFYVESKLKQPGFFGQWPGFWMLSDDGSWPPEIDILEGYNHIETLSGGQSGIVSTSTMHSNMTGWTELIGTGQFPEFRNSTFSGYVNQDSSGGCCIPYASPALGGINPVTNFVTYGVLVYPDIVAVFYDGVCRMIWPTPSDFMGRRWYILYDNTVQALGDTGGVLATDFGVMEISDFGAYKMPATYATIAGSGGGTTGGGTTGGGTTGGTTTGTIPEIFPGTATITMSDGRILGLDANKNMTVNGVALPNGDGTFGVAYDVSKDPNGMFAMGNANDWYFTTGNGGFTPMAPPTNLVVVTGVAPFPWTGTGGTAPPPPPPPAGVTFTTAQWTAIQAAFATVLADASAISADAAAISINAAAVSARMANLQSTVTANAAAAAANATAATANAAAIAALKALLGI